MESYAISILNKCFRLEEGFVGVLFVCFIRSCLLLSMKRVLSKKTERDSEGLGSLRLYSVCHASMRT